MKKWLQTAQSGDRGESSRGLQEVCKDRITSVANQYFTKLWGVGEKQRRGAPSFEYRDRQKAKEQCVKTFLEQYDTVTAPSGEGQLVRQQMTVQVVEEVEVGERGDDEDYEREAPPPSDKDGCDWDGLSASFMT